MPKPVRQNHEREVIMLRIFPARGTWISAVPKRSRIISVVNINPIMSRRWVRMKIIEPRTVPRLLLTKNLLLIK